MKLGPKFQNIIPGIDLESVKAYLNKFDWNLSFQESEGQRLVFSGNVLLLSTQEKLEMEAFLVGMAFSLAMLPPEIQGEIKDKFGAE